MRDSFNEINITPLTDIFLVLLIIMMVIAPLLDQQGLNLAVPEVVNEEQIMKDSKIMNVSVTSDNKFIWDGQEIEAANLEQVFSDNAKNYPDGLLIQADDDSEHGAIVKVMDSARNVGITSISLSRG
ncbi:MAG: biopolymer transporter ExbD [Candidatus Gastranaerophilales bacterium]|nr:biopolymer transporter ExbD [Candidatus Gastranaerophilales bacterium]MCM1073726.1 biopolymer transporter ExbD [Bacteroides sp.]